jgi:hypothetical protein
MEVLHEAGSVKLGTESYRLVRSEGKRDWEGRSEHEPPWLYNLPAIASEPQQTWHMGGLKSQQGTPGTSEYGQNTDTRYPLRLLPAPKVNVVTLTGSVATPTSIFEALGLIWVLAGRYVFAIDPSDDSVTLAKDFGPSVTAIMGLKWEGSYGLITTDAASLSLWRVTVGGFQSDTFQPNAFHVGDIGWSQTADVNAYRLAAGINRLFKIDKWGELKNVLSGNDPMVEANYADEVQMGDTDLPPNGLVAFERTALVGRAEGLLGVDIDGFGVPLLKRITKDNDNGLGMTVHEPHVIFPHLRGVLRYVPGYAESAGLEKETQNESPVDGPFKAFASDQQWLYGALWVSPSTYIMVARDRQDNPSFGPLIWDTWLYLNGKECQAMLPSAQTDPVRLWFGHGNDIAYAKLSGSEYCLSAVRYSSKLRFEDWEDKDFPKVKLAGKNLTVTRYWELSYSVDGGAFSNLDKDSNAMKITSDGLSTFFLPTSAVGRELQLKYTYVGDIASQAGELNYSEPFAVPQSQKIPIYVVQLRLAAGIRHEGSPDARTPLAQLNDLQALIEQAASVVSYGPWGDNVNVFARGLRLIEFSQEGEGEPEFLVELVLQKREDA